MRVAVIAGGRSSEHDVSLSSGRAVSDGLREAGHVVVEIEAGRDGRWRCDGRELEVTPGEGLLGADVAFPVLHGRYGEDGTVQGLLELLDVPYVGSGVAASAVCMDKLLSKDLMGHAGIPQVAYRGLHEPDVDAAAQLGFPQFVKPARAGSSLGMSRVADADELPAALELAFSHDERVIVEAASPGMEVECAVLIDAASTPGEIVLSGDWYDFQAKYTPGGMELVVPARISAAATATVRRTALQAFRLAGCAGLARVDFFVEGERVLLNELNTMPGFTPTSVYARLVGLPYAQLVDRLVNAAASTPRSKPAPIAEAAS